MRWHYAPGGTLEEPDVQVSLGSSLPVKVVRWVYDWLSSSFLKMGVILDDFHKVGTLPEEKEEL